MSGPLNFISDITSPKVYNVNNNHPLIPNSQDMIIYRKYISIHSEDRDILRYPNSNQFEIELPEDILNVLTVRLTNWSFPANYNTFSQLNSNISMTFKISNPYNPGDNAYSEALLNVIFECLFFSKDENFLIIIETGFYNPQQMVTELTNKFNEAVTLRIQKYLQNKVLSDPTTYQPLLDQFTANGGYSNFIIVYNTVNQKIWFGNRIDGFILTNETQIAKSALIDNLYCGAKSQLPDFSDWGLPGNLGLTKCDIVSLSEKGYTPRFYYGDVTPGDSGYWLLPIPGVPGCTVHYVQSPFKINLMGNAYIYMEIDGLNCIDETSPYNLSKFTVQTNQTNGVCNSAFAKMAVPTTPISQWFDRDQIPYKLFLPPAERIRKLKIKLRYHNGEMVDFGVFNYSFTLEFSTNQPQIERKYNAWGSGLR